MEMSSDTAKAIAAFQQTLVEFIDRIEELEKRVASLEDPATGFDGPAFGGPNLGKIDPQEPKE